MAIMYARPTSISRGSSRSAVSAAAYRSASRMELSFSDMSAAVRDKLSASYNEKYHLVNENTGEVIGLVFDYRDKSGAIISGIMAPDGAPEWVFDRQKLWQSIENAGTRVDSRLAREFTIALPIELTKEQNKELVKDFVRSSLVARGMVADYNIHLDNPENPHVHIMAVTRDLETNIDGKISWGKVNLAWKNLSVLKAIRAEVAVTINNHLEIYGHESRVSHLSHAARGLNIIPGVHEGPARWIKNAQLKQQNHEIALENAARIIADPTIVIDQLSIDKPVFSGNDIEKGLHKALIMGINPNLINEKESFELWCKSELLSMYNVVIASDKLTLVNPCDLKGRMLFARTDRIELEHRFEENVRELAAKSSHVINIKEEDIAEIAPGLKFSREQKQVIIDVLASGDISVLEGWPGSGKTTVIREIVRHYKEAGYTVIGTAPTNKASEELSVKTGIVAENTTKLRQLWQEAKTGNKAGLNISTDYYKEEHYQNNQVILPAKTILIVDEASMVDLPTLDYFTHEIKKSGGKIIEVGDNNQNPAIGYKGGFSKTGDIATRLVLMENNRHQNQDEHIREMHIEATKAMGRYEIAKAISIYDKLGMLKVFDNEEQKQQALADDYSSFVINLSKEKGDVFALSNTAIAAFTNLEVANLNSMVRHSLKNAGIIKGNGGLYYSNLESQEEEGLGQKKMIELCLGDQIIFKSNKQEFEGYGGVRNNELGIITKLGEVNENGCGEFEVRIREGKNGHRLVTIKTGEDILPVSFKHGYALTGHAVQGADVDQFFYSVDKHSGYEAFNVGSSRHRDDCSIYLDKETLENVVYKTKDLDVIAAKEEFKACAYKYEKIGEKWEQVDVPLWKVGLKLLISKRTDLNFATDYLGQLKDNRKKDAYQEIIAGNQGRLNKLYDDLNHWKKDKETQLIENNQQIASDSKESEQLAKELKNFSSLEICLQKDFIINKGELIIDPMAIAKAVDNYKFLKEKNGSKFKSTKDLTDKINKQLASLKHGSYKDSDKEKIKWMDLGEIDKNLIIRSHLSKKDLSFLAKKEKQIKRYEERISAYANKIAVIHENLAKQTDKSNKLLTGNLGAMRDYLDAREKVLAAQEKITELDLYFKKPAIEKQLSSEVLASFGVKITKFNLTAAGVIRAETAFRAKHFRDNAERIEQLKKDRDNLESAKLLKELFDIDLQKTKYLSDFESKNQILNADDKHLIAGVILQKTKSAILHGKYQEITETLEELNEARKERQNRAQVIVDYYHGFVRDDLDEKINVINNGFLQEALLIQEEWTGLQKKQISKNLGAGFAHSFSEEYYRTTVLGEDSTAQLVLKNDLCSAATKDAKSKLVLFDQRQKTFDLELQELKKQIENSKLGKEATHEHEVVMGKLISQLQINYETVRKHAGLEEVKHYFASIDKNGTIISNPHFSKIMDVVELANQENSVIDSEKVAIVMEAQGEVLRICADHKKELADKGLLQTKLSTKHAEELEQLKKMAKFKNEELPNFLGKIYKDGGKKVLTRFEQLIAETNRPLLLAKAIGESPEMLGDLKSMSLWASITKGGEVKGIRANLENLGANLIKYINEDAMRAELQENLDSSKLVHQIKALDLEIANLKALLPNKEEQKLLDDIEHLKDSGKSELKGGGEEIKTLFKGDNAHDLLLDSIALKGEGSFNNNNINVNINNQKLAEKQLPRVDDKVKAGSKSRGMRQSEAWNSDPKLDFKNVKASLTSSHIENIFRDYAAKLNPDGKIIKRGSSISCGSLNMNLKNGLWHRFSDGSKGDVFSLIEQATGSQKRDALLIVANIVGINAETKNNNKLRNQIDTNHDNQDSKQTPIVRNNVEAYKIIPSTAPRLNIDTHLSWLAKTNKIDNIWTYRNQKGELIGGTIRVVDKVTGKKQVMPVSYCHNSKDGSDQWKLKGFTDNGYKPIYGIEKLANENKPILIVEGEKTADHAQTLLPGYSVISWMGGAQGTAKVNWRQLGGREVTIWPDNDVAGEGAGRSILQELNKINGFSGFASLVDTKNLNLPEKWDLADKMPEHLSLGGIKEAIISCQNKGKNITTYIEEASQHNNKNGQKVFWQQASIGIKDSSQEIERKSSLYEEIHERLSSKEVVSYMDYAKASGRDEPLHQFLSFKDGLYQEMLTSSMVNHLEITAGSEVATKLKNLFGRDEDGNYLATPKEIVEQVQNIYSNSNSAKYQINNEKYISDNKKLAASNTDKAKLHEVLMKDFCILHQDQLGVKDLINVHKDKISDDLYKIISNYDLNNKDGQGGLKDSDQTKIAELAHNKINNTKWWQDLVEDQIKLAKTSKIEIITETDKRLELIEEHIKVAMAASSIDNESVLARATSHYLEYIMANIDNMNNKELINKLVERAVYEEANIASRKENMRVFLIEDKKYGEFKKASGKLWQELMGEKLVKAEWQIQEKSPDLTNTQVRSIAKELVYNNYEQEVAQVIKEEPAVSVLHKQNPIAGKYLAEGLVDFRNNYGEELLTEARTKVMEEVAITQAELHDKIDNKMQGLDNKILEGKHKSLSGDILDGTVLAGDRDMTAKSVTSQAGEDLTHDMLLRGNAHYEQLHDHPEYHNHNTKIDHDSHHGLEYEHQHEITTQIQQTRTMQHEYHQRMEQEHEKQININNDININY